MADAAVPAKRPLFDGFLNYLRWWLLFAILVALPTVITLRDGKGIELLGALGTGVLYALVFTPVQNLINPDRKRWLAWLIAIATWLVIRFALVAAAIALGMPLQ